jgi:ATP-dependent protease HslVU (ClpYQ) ATPase subunit
VDKKILICAPTHNATNEIMKRMI